MSDLLVTTVSRSAVRNEIASGLTTALGNAIRQLAGYQKANFEDLTPFVRVYGEGSDRGARGGNSIGALMTTYFYTAQAWVPYTWPASGWNEEDAENAIDVVEQKVAEWVASDHGGASWHEIAYADRTFINILKLASGRVYIVEDIPLMVRVFV